MSDPGRAILDALDKAYAAAGTFELRHDQPVVILSDLHKGARDGADDFLRCERSYNAALTYYHALGYHLMELGDVEELWENSVDEVLRSYEVSLGLAAGFHAEGRYTRFFGNHDLAWKSGELFAEHMSRWFPELEPIEALRIVVLDEDGRRTGELFLAHGHQGTADSDRLAFLSRLFVRHGWRWLQRRLNRPWNTPSVDWALRGDHAAHMRDWADRHKRVLIAGHTHLPVFFNNAKAPDQAPPALAPTDASDEAQALDDARAAWAAAEVVRLTYQRPIPLDRPGYFNTGCCAFGDGDITGIELIGGKICLIRWACDPRTEREVLAAMDLADVFLRIGA